MSNVKNYADQPCDRCGSKKRVSKTWKEVIATTSGTTTIEVSQTICTNRACKELFEKNRAEDLVKINARKALKEDQDKVRRDNIARTISERKKSKITT